MLRTGTRNRTSHCSRLIIYLYTVYSKNNISTNTKFWFSTWFFSEFLLRNSITSIFYTWKKHAEYILLWNILDTYFFKFTTRKYHIRGFCNVTHIPLMFYKNQQGKTLNVIKSCRRQLYCIAAQIWQIWRKRNLRI